MNRIIIFLLMLSTAINAQIADTIFLWPGDVPGETEKKHLPVKTDNTSRNVTRLTDVTNPALLVFKPEKSNNNGGTVIICPGGGYNILAIDLEGYEIAAWFNKLGYTAFVLEYRVPQKQEGALMDLQRAIRIVRANAETYQINPKKIGILGFSAGGSLCARAATRFNESLYPQVDAFDTLSCRPDFSMLIYPAYLDQGENRSLTSELHITEDSPPFFIFGTADDKYGNSALVMTTALRDHKIPVDLHLLSEGGHGYGLRKGNVAADTWPVLLESWLEKLPILDLERTFFFPKNSIPVSPSEKQENIWVFVLAGQSNMAGRGFVEPKDTIPSDRIYTINQNNEIVLAKEPLHFYEPKLTGLDCGLSFGMELLNNVPDSISILLLPTAVGGSSISQWIGDSIHRNVALLSNFTEKVEVGKKVGVLKGILWHQGESDASDSKIAVYQEKLESLFHAFREIVGNKELPIIVGELGSYSKKQNEWKELNKTIGNYVSKDIHSVLVETGDLRDKGDKVHFSAEGLRILGERFANAYLNHIK